MREAVTLERLQQNAQSHLAEVAGIARGMVGMAAWRLGQDAPRLLLDADTPFPMASTFKIAVACRILEQVDAGACSLDELIPVTEDKRMITSIIADRFPHSGIQLSVHNLVQVMLDESDNTATDLLLDKAGGAVSVTAMLGRWGITEQRVDRGTREIVADFFGLPPGSPASAIAAKVEDPDFLARCQSINPSFESDWRDTSTPNAMNTLLENAFGGERLSMTSTFVLRDIMTRCRTSSSRIRGLLPLNTLVADKTGTIGSVTNDAGLITLPGERGEVLISVFIKSSAAAPADRERVIAEISRLVFDYFLFTA